jgi:hypothetical protein
MVDGDGVRVVEKKQCKWSYDPGQDFIEPERPFGLERPEVGKSVIGDLAPVHHFAGTPYIMFPGNIQLSEYRTVHLTVVSDNYTRLIREYFRIPAFEFRRKKPDKKFDNFV